MKAFSCLYFSSNIPEQSESWRLKQDRSQEPMGKGTSPENAYANNKNFSKPDLVTSPGAQVYQCNSTMPGNFRDQKQIREFPNRGQTGLKINPGYGSPKYSVQVRRDPQSQAEMGDRTNQQQNGFQGRQASFGEPKKLHSDRGPSDQQPTIPMSAPPYYTHTGQQVTEVTSQSAASQRRSVNKTRVRSLPDDFSHSSHQGAPQARGGPTQYVSHNNHQPSYNQNPYSPGYSDNLPSHRQ